MAVAAAGAVTVARRFETKTLVSAFMHEWGSPCFWISQIPTWARGARVASKHAPSNLRLETQLGNRQIAVYWGVDRDSLNLNNYWAPLSCAYKIIQHFGR